MGPLQPDDGPLGQRLIRRTRGIFLETLAFVLVTLLLPLLVLIAVNVDIFHWLTKRKPWMATRLAVMLWWFLAGEMRALLGLLYIYTRSLGRDSAWRRRAVYDLRETWASGHLAGVEKLFGVTFDVEGLQDVSHGPVIVMMRHASIVDNLLPDFTLGREHRLGLRFVIKRELEMIPTIDIAGRWIPTNYVRRESGDPAAELAKLRQLTIDLGDDEGVMIYPEGTRYTPKKAARALEKIGASQPELLPYAQQFKHVLPPRLGGPIALMEDAPEADIVFCAHVGLDGFVHVSDVWAGALLNTVVQVQFRRYPASEVPTDKDARVKWLMERWLEVDEWIGSHK